MTRIVLEKVINLRQFYCYQLNYSLFFNLNELGNWVLYFGTEGVIYLFERLLIIKFDEKLQHKFIYLKVASRIQPIAFLICNGIDTKEGEPWCSGKVVPWWLVGHGFESGNGLFAYARVRLRTTSLPHTFA